ncbi:hypothetical protein MCUN1_002810 [Malassezia cuniculi]|uniref:peptidylprolyl isomerase n=1 Tax=Malassezia cuniculi TaxID=948313 RepID=A0AAF0J7Q6_9BASI|nr:hypothetical protein MCUN1_002810 [Malassezia cuniculi]
MTRRRDTLLASLEDALAKRPPALAESGSVRLVTLFSVPRRVSSLYPLAHAGESEPVGTWQEHVVITAGWRPTDGQERLFYALELYVYTLPAQSAAVVYVSKLDSTGFAPKAVPKDVRDHLDTKTPSITVTLTSAAIEYFVSRRHWKTNVEHVSLHIFARAQAAYLFPASPRNKNKHVLSDTALIRWWRACVSEAILMSKSSANAYYAIPGVSRLDSHPLVPLPGQDIVGEAGWKYGHPYDEQQQSLPLHPQPPESRSSSDAWFPAKRTLANTIPVFPDDPMGRFINELASQAHEPGTARPSGVSQAERTALMERRALERTSIESYWEGLGFRQECSSGNIAGVFIVSFTGESSGERVAPSAQPHALPYPMLGELVLEYIQQDKCDWSGDEAPRLTEQYYNGVDLADVLPSQRTDTMAATPVEFFTLKLIPGEVYHLDTIRDLQITNVSYSDPEHLQSRNRSVLRVHYSGNPSFDFDDDEEDDEDEDDEDDEEEDDDEEDDEEEDDEEEDDDEDNEDSAVALLDGSEPIFTEEDSYAVCSLIPEKVEHVSLNLHFCEDEDVGISVSGDEPVDIIGNYLINPDFDRDPIPYDEEDDEDEDDEDDEDEDDEDDDDEDEDEEDDDEDDEDDDDEVPEIADIEAIEYDEEDDDEEDDDEEDEEAAAVVVPSKKRSAVEIEDEEPKLSRNQRKRLNKKLRAEGAAAFIEVPEPKKDKKTGSGPVAKPGSRVSMRYVGKLQNGSIFDSNTKGRPFSFRLGKGEVIKGMQVGGERRLTCPPHLAYGRTKLPGIPANSTLIFDVKLLEVK